MVKKRRAFRGFTLIEVIIALSLFAVSVMVLTQSFVNGLSLKASLKHESKQPLMYEMIRASLLQMKRESVPSTHKFVYPASEDGFSWQGKVEASDWPSLFKVIVKIDGELEEEDPLEAEICVDQRLEYLESELKKCDEKETLLRQELSELQKKLQEMQKIAMKSQ